MLSGTAAQILELHFPVDGDAALNAVNETVRNALRPIAHTRPALSKVREMLAPYLRTGCVKVCDKYPAN